MLRETDPGSHGTPPRYRCRPFCDQHFTPQRRWQRPSALFIDPYRKSKQLSIGRLAPLHLSEQARGRTEGAEPQPPMLLARPHSRHVHLQEVLCPAKGVRHERERLAHPLRHAEDCIPMGAERAHMHAGSMLFFALY